MFTANRKRSQLIRHVVNGVLMAFHIHSGDLVEQCKCFTVKLQNCSVDSDTSPDFISSGAGEDM